MKNSADTARRRIFDHRAGIVFGIARVDYERTVQLRGQPDLRRESRALQLTRRIVIVVIEPALTDRDCAGCDALFN
jgi:hypothetical protein